MTAFLDNINWQRPGIVNLEVPKSTSMFNKETMQGQLYLSKNKYMYSIVSKPIIWLKFLGIGIALPFIAVAASIKEFAACLFGKSTPAKGFHDWEHVGKLLGIAWKAVVGAGSPSILEDVEKFALAEVEYNNPDPIKELDKRRSERFLKGVYLAKCMQPLFHQTQSTALKPARLRLVEVKQTKKNLEASLQKKQAGTQKQGWTHKIFSSTNSLFDPYSNLSIDQVKQEIERVDKQLHDLPILISRAEKCEAYALEAIRQQQSICEANTETVEECRCFDVTCYKHQRVCGLVHKVECCASKCWAIDCICCVLCFWPDGGRCCVI